MFSIDYYIKSLDSSKVCNHVPRNIKCEIASYIYYGRVVCGNKKCLKSYKNLYNVGHFIPGEEYPLDYIYTHQLHYKNFMPHFYYFNYTFERYYCIKCAMKKNIQLTIQDNANTYERLPLQSCGYNKINSNFYSLINSVINLTCNYCQTYNKPINSTNYYKCNFCSLLICKNGCKHHLYK